MSVSVSRPKPLLPATISLVLEYIAPPSLLSSLPPHLISSALAQRHRFLHISPDNPAQYLAWPTDSHPDAQQIAIDLLESFQKQLDHPVYTIRYATDAESAFAHVAISPEDPQGLRLIFQWNPPDGWKFHNLTLMPFPPNIYESINDSIVCNSHDFLDEPQITLVEDDERDTYWDAYGLSQDHDDQSGFSKPKVDLDSGAEDAYWAQYSAIHGSGDSTLPTPSTVNRKLSGERVIVSCPGHRSDASASASLRPSPTSHAMMLSSSSINYPSSLLSIDTWASSSYISPAISPVVEFALEGSDESRDALKDTIRSVYRLWKAGRVIGSLTSDQDAQEFLEIVRQVVAESSLQ